MTQQLFAFTKHVRPVRAVPCDICGRKALTSEDRYVHDHCQGTIQPCPCGQPSMPFPDCPTCHGSGRLGDRTICNACPPGPCVGCCSKALLERVRAERG